MLNHAIKSFVVTVTIAGSVLSGASECSATELSASDQSNSSILTSDEDAKKIKASVGESISMIADEKNDFHSTSNNLAQLKSKHPRLIISNDEITALQKTIASDTVAADLFKVLKGRADQIILSSPAPRYGTTSNESLTESRLALKQITTLAGIYRLTGESKYAFHAKQIMLSIVKFSDWGSKNFLCVAEMTAAMAIGYDWLFDTMSIDERQQIRDGITKNGLRPGLNQYKGEGWWRVAPNNWNFVCNGGLSMGALAVADDEPEIAKKILDCALLSIPLALKTFAPDGGWPEGPGYWTYGTRYLVYFLASLHTSLGHDFSFSLVPGLSETGFFRIYSEGPLGLSFNFADSESEVARGAQMLWFSRRYKQPVYAGAELPIALRAPEMFHLLFYTSNHSTPQQNKLPESRIFSGVNVAFMRSQWGNPDAFFVGFKGGDNKSPHAHLDLGSFVLDALGYRFAEDLGPDDYELPGYFKAKRWSYYRTQTQSHNTLTVQSKNQDERAASKIISSSISKLHSHAVVDLSAAYAQSLKSVRRGIALDSVNGDGHRVTVQDEIEAENLVDVIWHLHTRAIVSISNNGKSALLEGSIGDKKVFLRANILSPVNASFQAKHINTPREEAQQPDVFDLTIPLKVSKGRAKILVTFAEEKSAPPSSVPQIETNVKINDLKNW